MVKCSRQNATALNGEKMSIIITGGTGQLGRFAIEELIAAGSAAEQIVATGRDEIKLARLSSDLGVTTRRADFSDAATLPTAFDGADKLLLVSTTDVGLRIGNHQHAIDAARDAGVGLIVYTSMLNADTASMQLAREHHLTEEYLKKSGVPFVILRNGWYLERYTDQIANVLQEHTLVGGAGGGLIAAATRRDYATAAAAAITQAGHAGSTYDLGGDAFTLTELAGIIGDAANVNVTYTDLTEGAHTELLVSVGVPVRLAEILADADAGIARNELFTASRDLERLLGHTPTTPREAVDAALAQLPRSAESLLD